jgi:hypothetical protein
MGVLNRNARVSSMTLSGPAPPTPKDDALIGDVLYVRGLVIDEARRRHAKLIAIRPPGHISTWEPAAGARFYAALEALWENLGRLWTQAELACDVLPVATGFACGRMGRPRKMARATLKLVARSIELHTGGRSWAEADELAAPSYDMSALDQYRKRVRDRLDKPMTPRRRREQVEVNIALTTNTGGRLDGFHPGSFERGCRCGDCMSAQPHAEVAAGRLRRFTQAELECAEARLGLPAGAFGKLDAAGVIYVSP